MQSLAGTIIVKPIKKDTSASVSIATEQPEDGGRKGEVVSVGPEWISPFGIKVPCPVVVGDVILYKQFGSYEFNHEGRRYVSCEFQSILAVLPVKEDK